MKLRDGKEKISSLAQLEGLETLRIVILIRNRIKCRVMKTQKIISKV